MVADYGYIGSVLLDNLSTGRDTAGAAQGGARWCASSGSWTRGASRLVACSLGWTISPGDGGVWQAIDK